MAEPIPVTASIITIIKEAVAASSLSPPLDFGHGTEAYANIQGQDKKITGDVAWLMPVMIRDTIQAGGVMDSKYLVLLLLGQLSDLSNDAEALQEEVELMLALAKKVTLILDDDQRVKEITDIRREAVYFSRDLNITGAGLGMTIELEHEEFDYCGVQS